MMLHFSRWTFFSWPAEFYRTMNRWTKKTTELLMFSHVCHAAVCIFVPVLEIKGVTSVFSRHSDRLLKLGLVTDATMILTTRRRWRSAAAATSGNDFKFDLRAFWMVPRLVSSNLQAYKLNFILFLLHYIHKMFNHKWRRRRIAVV